MLGLETVSLEEADRFCLFTTGESGAMLALASDHPEQSTTTGENRLASGLRVSDLDKTLLRLRSAGVRIDADIDGADEGYRLARIWDPEGNRLHLYRYLEHLALAARRVTRVPPLPR